jgi:dTDP-4-dehydrorhamnose 3,5-epimerase
MYSETLAERSDMIEGVAFKQLSTHADDRGFFRELIRVTDTCFAEGFGQLSHSLVYHGIVKAWHAHTRQTQWTYVVCGTLKVVLHDTRPESSTFRETMEFLAGDGHPESVYMFPPHVAHGYMCVNGPAHVLYVTSGIYDLTDEIRLPHDDKSIGYDWTKAVRIR